MDNTSIDHPIGMVDNTNEQYHSGPGISKSHLDVIAGKSPKHYWHKYLNPNPEPRVETPAMKVGTAVHTAILEPHDLDNRIVKGLNIERRSNADKATWAEFEESHKGKIILSADNYEHVLRIRDALHNDPDAAGLLTGGKAEQSFYAYDQGVIIDHETGEIIEKPQLIKCRTDYLLDGGNVVVDVKSTEDASLTGFGKSIANYRYDVQAAWYFNVIELACGWVPTDWVFVAFEKEPPYAISIQPLLQSDIDRARNAALRDYRRIIELKHAYGADVWPGYGVQTAQLPGWVKR